MAKSTKQNTKCFEVCPLAERTQDCSAILMMREDILIDEVLKFSVTRAAIIDPSGITYSPEFRDLCEQNKCGHYGKNWMCPPAVGPYEKLKTKASQYKKGLVFQTVHKLSHSRDRKGLHEAFKAHDEALKKIITYLRDKHGIEDMLPLGAGPCTYCEKCVLLDGEKCRFPDHAVASLESHGIDVGALVKMYGMPYTSGKDTVTLVGAVLYVTP
ncbi:MAG: putative metal-binding protein [Deltaproteobacteria bacterium]|nr:putative metal-binding protein [Deltaproteobacteria bacterium]